MMYDMSKNSFPAKPSDGDASKPAEQQWPLIKNDSIKLVLEIGQVYDRTGKLASCCCANSQSHFNLP